MGYARVGSSLLLRASRPRTFPGCSDAGSTCSPSLGVLATAVMFSYGQLGRVRSGDSAPRFIVRSMPQHRPRDPRHLVGERRRRDVWM
jgi:hypothetical protein